MMSFACQLSVCKASKGHDESKKPRYEGRDKDWSKVKCFKCKEWGHEMKDCKADDA